jgi:hypothetical protein
LTTAKERRKEKKIRGGTVGDFSLFHLFFLLNKIRKGKIYYFFFFHSGEEMFITLRAGKVKKKKKKREIIKKELMT